MPRVSIRSRRCDMSKWLWMRKIFKRRWRWLPESTTARRGYISIMTFNALVSAARPNVS
jgi:hypothetical protein